MDYTDNFFKDITPQECWVHAGHIIAGYLLMPDLPLLFDRKNALNPNNWRNYESKQKLLNQKSYEYKQKQLKTDDNEITQLRAEVSEIEKSFNELFASLLVEFFQLRLLGSQKDIDAYLNHFDKYLALFLNLIGEGDQKTPMLTLSYQFLDMMKDYILRNCPGLPSTAETMSIHDLLQEVRKLYDSCAKNPRYQNFKKNAYTAGILSLMDKISQTKTQKIEYSYFLIVSEYLIGLMIYAFMIEHIIYRKEATKEKGEPKAPNLIFKLYTPAPQKQK